MKNLLLALLVAGLFGCSSSEKHEPGDHDSTEAVTDQAKAAIEEAAEDLKDAAEDLKTAANDKAEEETTTTTASNDGAFPAYEGTESSKITCTNGDDVRTITVLNGNEGGCGVVYNKFGEDRTVAVAKYTMEHCSNVQEKIKGNLEEPGFTCQ